MSFPGVLVRDFTTYNINDWINSNMCYIMNKDNKLANVKTVCPILFNCINGLETHQYQNVKQRPHIQVISECLLISNHLKQGYLVRVEKLCYEGKVSN